MADRWTITCGVCGLIGPALARDLPPSTGCLHDADVPEGDRICYPARVTVLEHALRRAIAPDCFDADGKILPGKIGHVLTEAHWALVRSAARLRPQQPDPATDPITVAAPHMIKEMQRGIEMIHDALADPARSRQSCGEVANWWLRYANKCVSYVCDDPAAGAKAREANNG